MSADYAGILGLGYLADSVSEVIGQRMLFDVDRSSQLCSGSVASAVTELLDYR
jgi:hypothetical protein